MSAMVNETSNKALFHRAVGREVDLRVQEVILRPSRDQSGGCHSGSILRSFWVDSEVILRPILDPILGNLINMQELPSFGRR